ncbi:unnamed protein product [marine sediment metagenome]|uniref:Uncharacterized protein n=1 Tax=marine sediment metagenome TaxID=412755 RepID=X0WDK9_9ZZZZ
MKLIKRVKEEEVWGHWEKVEKWRDKGVRWDIRGGLPPRTDMNWYEARIEEKDIEKIYIISSEDWRVITKSFKVSEAVQSLKKGIDDAKIDDILKKKEKYMSDINSIDRKLILICTSEEGNYTIIEGNKRAVALLSINRLVNTEIYLGISKKIQNYGWAHYANKGAACTENIES